MKQTVTSHIEISPNVFLLGVERRFDFLPGQTVKLGLGDSEPPRIYSICSGNQDDELKILYNIKEDGALTPHLAQLCPGDAIEVSEPCGTFVGTHDPALWIATGTGIAPFYSMLRSGLGENKMLVQGARFNNQFYFSNDWGNALGENYHRFCSGEEVDGTRRGRVQQYLESAELPSDRKVYICGQAQMCVEVRDLLIEKGVPFGNIVTEIYF
jgi:ferredoxin--NADP+ reductase